MKTLKLILTLCILPFLANAKSPNILLVHLDDENFAGQDFSEYIPSIKALQSEALELNNFYSTTFNETVVELLSGKYPFNVKNVGILGDMQSDEPCVAKDLKELGYASAYIGKWRNSSEVFPSDLGFDLFYGILDSDLKWPYDWQMKQAIAGKLQEEWIKEPTLSLMMNSNIIEMPVSTKKLVPTFTQEALSFILHNQNKDKPFFMYLNYASFYAPELGLKKFFPETDKSRIAKHYVDINASLAKILKLLERQGTLDDTMIIFIAKSALNPEPMPKLLSTNMHADAFYKKSAFIYMPKLFKEPKSLNGIVATLDMPAFMIDCAKGANGENSMLGYFLNKHPCDESPILFYAGSKYLFAMRDKNYKVVVEKLNLKVQTQLYDLDKDPNEENDLAKTMNEKGVELLRQARYLDSLQPKVLNKEEVKKLEQIAKQKEAEREKLAKKKEKEAKEKADKLKREAKAKEEKAKAEKAKLEKLKQEQAKAEKAKKEAITKAEKLKKEALAKAESEKIEKSKLEKAKKEAMAKAEKLKKEALLKAQKE